LLSKITFPGFPDKFLNFLYTVPVTLLLVQNNKAKINLCKVSYSRTNNNAYLKLKVPET